MINRLKIYTDPATRAKLVEWYLNDGYCPLNPSTLFYVESARSAEDWVRLNPDDPVVNGNSYVDTAIYNYDLKKNLYYRVVAELDGKEYVSDPVSVFGGLNRKEHQLSRMIMKKEMERAEKESAGTRGHILKRRVWGLPCSICKDYDLDAVINTRCEICYGTGIRGGYFNGLPYTMSFQMDSPDKEEIKDGFGLEDIRMVQARGIAYPLLAPYDVWVAEDTNRRYVIRQVQTVAELRSNPVLYDVVMSEILPTRPEYMVPLESSEVETTTPESWRTALTPDY